MAIVTSTSNLVQDHFDPADVAPDPVAARGRLIVSTGTVTNAADDSNTSLYHLIDLPSICLMHEDTFFDVENDGFAQIVIGTLTDTDALLDVARAAATTQQPFAIGDANHGKALWEILGLAADPGGMIGIYKHAEANATAAGEMPFRFAYLMP